MSSSIDGLVSGLSTSSLISSLMQVEAAPQNRLKSKVATAEGVVSAYQSVNATLLALKKAADELGRENTWRAVKPTSSSPALTVSAGGGLTSATGTMTFDVERLASSQVSTARFPAPADPTAPGDVTSDATFKIVIGADETDVDISADKTLRGVAKAINSAGVTVKASVVTTSAGDEILQLTAGQSGTVNGFSVSGLSFVTVDPVSGSPSAFVDAVPAQDAQIRVGGSDAEGGYVVTSSSNTFSNLMSGVTLTAIKVENDVTVNATSDISAVTNKLQAFVDAANATLGETSKQTAYDPSTKRGGTLTGDFAVRQIGMSLLSTISQGVPHENPDQTTELISLSKLGIDLDRAGHLSFDAGKFAEYHRANPDLATEVGTAFATSVEALAKKHSTSVTAAVNGRKTLIDSMNVQIDNWAVRLNARQDALQKQYATLETTLSKLQSQSTWLSGQISSLG